MSFWDGRTARALLTALMIAAVVAAAVVARRVLFLFVFVVLFSYLMEPIVSRVQRWVRGSRWKAVAITYVAFWTIAGTFLFTAGQSAFQEGQRAAQQLPQFSAKLQSGDIAADIGKKTGFKDRTIEQLRQFIQTHSQFLPDLARKIVSRIPGYVATMGWMLLVPLLAMLVPQNKVGPVIQWLDAIDSGPQQRVRQATLMQIDKMLGAYMWAQAMLVMIAFTVFLTVFTIFHVPYAAFLAVLGSVLELVPIIGPLTTATIVMGTAIASGFPHWLGLLIFLGSFRLVQDYVNIPLLMKSELELHPLAVILAVLTGGEVAGPLGMVIAIPVAAAIRIAWNNWMRDRKGQPVAVEEERSLAA
jgi:predicted PurR-regulated permease PerM